MVTLPSRDAGQLVLCLWQLVRPDDVEPGSDVRQLVGPQAAQGDALHGRHHRRALAPVEDWRVAMGPLTARGPDRPLKTSRSCCLPLDLRSLMTLTLSIHGGACVPSIDPEEGLLPLADGGDVDVAPAGVARLKGASAAAQAAELAGIVAELGERHRRADRPLPDPVG